jgi:hypothetical protein
MCEVKWKLLYLLIVLHMVSNGQHILQTCPIIKHKACMPINNSTQYGGIPFSHIMSQIVHLFTNNTIHIQYLSSTVLMTSDMGRHCAIYHKHGYASYGCMVTWLNLQFYTVMQFIVFHKHLISNLVIFPYKVIKL